MKLHLLDSRAHIILLHMYAKMFFMYSNSYFISIGVWIKHNTSQWMFVYDMETITLRGFLILMSFLSPVSMSFAARSFLLYWILYRMYMYIIGQCNSNTCSSFVNNQNKTKTPDKPFSVIFVFCACYKNMDRFYWQCDCIAEG